MGKAQKKGRENSLEDLAASLEKLVEGLPDGAVAPGNLRGVRKRLESLAAALTSASERLDPTKRPATVFDPANPAIVGRLIALAVIAQDRVPLARIKPFYGSGVYAIYYHGEFASYQPLSGTEHPIYVGKADPAKNGARTPVEQGTKLWGRLNDHKKNIGKADNLNVSDFQCRFLVVASGWQKAAEDYLIQLFRPIWNSEVSLLFGIGKHGDAPATRANKRSPWDTLHPGRSWAADRKLVDQKSISKIEAELSSHFLSVKPYHHVQDIFERFMSEMHQLPAISSSDASTK
jgi:hypothetical protein